MDDSVLNQIPIETKKVSFQTQHSIQTGSTRKKYLLKKQKIDDSKIKSTPRKSNIFDLTSTINNSYSQINTPTNSAAGSRLYTNSLFSSPSKETLVENPQTRLVLPIVTESKYNFKPIFALPKIKVQKVHAKASFYEESAAKIDEFNIKRMKRYKKLWAQNAQLRTDKSLLQRSQEKADKYILSHNSQFLKRKVAIQFETILRDRHIKQENRIGQCKAIPNRSLKGLKGKGGSVQSLFEEMYAVEEVYKVSK